MGMLMTLPVVVTYTEFSYRPFGGKIIELHYA